MTYRHTTHAARLERWLGIEQVERISQAQRGFRHPVAIANVPGRVYVYDGEFYGKIEAGGFASLMDYFLPRLNPLAGFTSLDHLIQERTANGKGQSFFFNKAGTLAVTSAQASLWNVGARPGAGGAPPARPGGAAPDNTTTGSFQQSNAAAGDTLHFVTGFEQGSVASNTLLLYDRIFHAGSILHNTALAQTITGVPTRYATTTSPGNFAFLEVTTALSNTAHTITMQYTDQNGNPAENAPALSGINTAAITRIDHTPYFIPLNAADMGLRTCTQITISAGTAGVSNFVMGHPIAFLPCPAANSMVVMDGINSAFSFERILDGACLALLELKGIATATVYNGSVLMVSGFSA